jgi:transposase
MGQQILIGAERRRRWSDGQKLSILREVGLDGARVAVVARRHNLTRQYIYQWRAHLRAKGLWGSDGNAAFLPVEMQDLFRRQHRPPARFDRDFVQQRPQALWH